MLFLVLLSLKWRDSFQIKINLFQTIYNTDLIQVIKNFYCNDIPFGQTFFNDFTVYYNNSNGIYKQIFKSKTVK